MINFEVPRIEWKKESGEALSLEEQKKILKDMGLEEKWMTDEVYTGCRNFDELIEIVYATSFILYQNLTASGVDVEQAQLFMPTFYREGNVSRE